MRIIKQLLIHQPSTKKTHIQIQIQIISWNVSFIIAETNQFITKQNNNQSELFIILKEHRILGDDERQFLCTLHSTILYINPYNIIKSIYYKNGVSYKIFNCTLPLDQTQGCFLNISKKQLNYQIKILGNADNLAGKVTFSQNEDLVQKNNKNKLYMKAVNKFLRVWSYANQKFSSIIIFLMQYYQYLGIEINHSAQIKQQIQDLKYCTNFKICILLNVSLEMVLDPKFYQLQFTYSLIYLQLTSIIILKQTCQQYTGKLRIKFFQQLMRLSKNTLNQFCRSLLRTCELNQKGQIEQIYEKNQQRQLPISNYLHDKIINLKQQESKNFISEDWLCYQT